MEEKKAYVAPAMEVLHFETEDVIVTSGNETELDPYPHM